MSDMSVPQPRGSPGQLALSTTLVIAIVVAALYFGRDIFIPLTLSILLSFVLTPPILWLRRHGVPRIAALALVVVIAFAGIGGVAAAVGSQLVQLAEELPSYQQNIQQKLESLRASAPGASLFERLASTLRDLRSQLSRASDNTSKTGPRDRTGMPTREPVPVVVEPAPMQPLEVFQSVLGPLLGPLGTAGLVVLFVIFILLEREELRDRFIKLVSGGDLQRSTEAITEAASRVSRYLLMQLVVNATYGIPIGLGLWIIGVPNAVLWGVLSALLRFVPYLGPWIAALFPLIIAVGVDPGWSMLIWTVALFLVAELISNNVVEPWLYGSSTGLSSFAIIVAAIFWTSLWGPVGLFLSTPITVCLVVIGRYVPNLEFLGVALGSEPVLSPAEQFYQRLLAGNLEEAIEMAEKHVDESSTVSFYDEVAIPALRMAENDRNRSTDLEFRRSIADGTTAVVREVLDHVAKPEVEGEKRDPVRPAFPHRPSVLCIGGRTELDQAAAEIVAGRLAEIGMATKTMAPISVSARAINQLDLDGIDVVMLSYFHPRPSLYVRFVCNRLQRRAPDLSAVVCCWDLAQDIPTAEDALNRQGANVAIETSVAAAEQSVLSLIERHAMPVARAHEHQAGPGDQVLLKRFRQLGLANGKGPAFEDLTNRISKRLGSCVVIVALADETCVTASPGSETTTPTTLTEIICAEVVAEGRAVVVDDVGADKRFANSTDLLEKGIRSFAAVPLRISDGQLVGALCVLGTDAFFMNDEDRLWLESLANEVVRSVDVGQSAQC